MESYKDYLIIISPSAEVIKQINKYKKASANKIGPFAGLHSTAYITITHQQRCKPFLVEPFILKMEKRLINMHSTELHISGFDFFKHGSIGYTIYATINTSSINCNWFKLLRKQMAIKLPNFVPHITIAQNIPPSAFKKIWPYFENDKYSVTFKANTLTILERDTFADGAEWRPFKEFNFGNRLVPF